jgi:hypothetical protein
MRRLSFLIVCLMLLAACGGSDDKSSSSAGNAPSDSSSSTEPETTPSSEPSSEPTQVSNLTNTFLHAGRYKTDLFKPGFAFKGHDAAYPLNVAAETENYVEFAKGPAYQGIILSRPTKMYASDNVSLEKAPPNPIDWFEDNEYLTTSPGPKVTVGDDTAPSIHVQISSIPDDQPVSDCPKCVSILAEEGAELLLMQNTDQLRVTQVEVAGEEVLVILITPKSDFGVFMKIGTEFLESVSWKK